MIDWQSLENRIPNAMELMTRHYNGWYHINPQTRLRPGRMYKATFARDPFVSTFITQADTKEHRHENSIMIGFISTELEKLQLEQEYADFHKFME